MGKKLSELPRQYTKINSGISILANKIFAPEWLPTSSHIFIHSGKIKYVGQFNGSLFEKSSLIVDAHNFTVCPGFIDMHTYGAFGIDTHSCSSEQLIDLSFRLPSFGVTTFIPSVGAGPKRVIQNAFQSVNDAMNNEFGAEILGIYSEGLCTNPSYQGAQRDIKKLCPTADFIEVVKKFPGILTILMLAPEIRKSTQIKTGVERLEQKTIFAVGHSGATSMQANAFFKNGYKLVTHLFNAMPTIYGREIGLAGAALLSKDTFVEIILDGIHIGFEAVQLVFQVKDKEKIIAITDSNAFAGMKEKNNKTLFLGQPVTVNRQAVFLRDGRLAASILTLDRALRNMVFECNLPFDVALCAITSNPARCLGVDNRKGAIKEGYDADIVFLDGFNNVRFTLARGMVLFNKLPRARIKRGNL